MPRGRNASSVTKRSGTDTGFAGFLVRRSPQWCCAALDARFAISIPSIRSPIWRRGTARVRASRTFLGGWRNAMTMISAIVAPAVTLSATACARYPMNVPSIMMFLVIVFAFGLGFDFTTVRRGDPQLQQHKRIEKTMNTPHSREFLIQQDNEIRRARRGAHEADEKNRRINHGRYRECPSLIIRGCRR